MQDVSIVMPVYNQDKIIKQNVLSLIDNSSSNVKELIFVVDGCSDNSEAEILRALAARHERNLPAKIIYTDNINEVLACNVGFRMATCPYIITIQDDMLIKEKDFDKRLLKPFSVVSNLLGVTARNAQDETIENGSLKCFNVAGKDVNSPRNLFAIRDVIVRGPIAFDHEKLEKCGYLDETFAPIDSDDKQLSFTAYKKFGYLVGSYVIDYESPLHWGKTRTDYQSNQKWVLSMQKKMASIISQHKDLLLGDKHDQDIIIEED